MGGEEKGRGRVGREERKGKGGGGGIEWEVGREGKKENILNGNRVDI